MIVVLATTLQAFRAHIAAGVLQEHGIEAWVWQDLSSSGYTPLTTGGCQLVVALKNAEEATKILIALPVTQSEADPESEQTETIDGVIWGAIVGVPIGILIWLLSAWRNDHPAGKIFIRLFMTVLCLLAALNL